MKNEEDFDSVEEFFEYLEGVFGKSDGVVSELQQRWSETTCLDERNELLVEAGYEPEDYEDCCED